MNKVINILVSIVFMISFVGIHIHKHFSHGELYSTAIFAEADNCCDDMEHCEMADMQISSENYQQESDCSCEDKTEVFVISNVFINEKDFFPNIEILSLFTVRLFDFKDSIILSVNYKINKNLSPPTIETDAQIEHCVYII